MGPSVTIPFRSYLNTVIVLTVNYTSKINKKLIGKKEFKFVVIRGREWGEGELDEDSDNSLVLGISFKSRRLSILARGPCKGCSILSLGR